MSIATLQGLIASLVSSGGLTTPGSLGTWSDTVAAFRRLDPSVDTRGGFQFTTGGAASELSSVDWEAAQVDAAGNHHCELWSDSSNAPGAKIGASSGSLSISTTGQKTFTWASRIALTAATKYWIILTPDSVGTGDTYWRTVNNNASYGSGRSGTITSITTTGLPSSEDWRVRVNYYT